MHASRRPEGGPRPTRAIAKTPATCDSATTVFPRIRAGMNRDHRGRRSYRGELAGIVVCEHDRIQADSQAMRNALERARLVAPGDLDRPRSRRGAAGSRARAANIASTSARLVTRHQRQEHARLPQVRQVLLQRPVCLGEDEPCCAVLAEHAVVECAVEVHRNALHRGQERGRQPAASELARDGEACPIGKARAADGFRPQVQPLRIQLRREGFEIAEMNAADLSAIDRRATCGLGNGQARTTMGLVVCARSAPTARTARTKDRRPQVRTAARCRARPGGHPRRRFRRTTANRRRARSTSRTRARSRRHRVARRTSRARWRDCDARSPAAIGMTTRLHTRPVERDSVARTASTATGRATAPLRLRLAES